LIDEWRYAYRMISVNLAAAGAVLTGAWMVTPPDMQRSVLTYMGVSEAAVPMAMFIAIVVGRLVRQPGLQEAVEDAKWARAEEQMNHEDAADAWERERAGRDGR
jgi:hypothetical protein